MGITKTLQSFQRDALPAGVLPPTFAGLLMLLASVLPWLGNPLGGFSNAWQLPLDPGWEFHIAFINYGLLCLCGASSCLLIAYTCCKPDWRGSGVVPGRALAAWLCLAPIILLLIQYLTIDLGTVNQIAQQKIQMLLLQSHYGYYGYRASGQLFPVTAFTLDISTFQGRLVLLGDQLSGGFLLPLLSAWIMFAHKQGKYPALEKKTTRNYRLAVIAGLVIVVLFWPGRAFAGVMCDKYARGLIAEGSYSQALTWLDTAAALNPALEQVAFYHIDRGHAFYYLHPDQQSDDSSVYLASTYLDQGNMPGAYQQLLTLWYADRIPPSFVRDEMSLTLEQMVESFSPAKLHDTTLDARVRELGKDELAEHWLQLLVQMDPLNAYGQYMIGRIDYDLHNYTGCKEQMAIALKLGNDYAFQSSIYTYMALSDAGLGDYAGERKLLLIAIQFDTSYHNNTAREELSGLR